MASVFKPKGMAKYIFFYTDVTGRRRKKTGTTDKAVTQRIAREFENRVALRREGLIDRADESFAANESRPLAEHLADFRKSLENKGGSVKHAKVSTNRAGRVLTLAKIRRVSDHPLSKALDAMGKLRAEGLGQETINHHVRAVKAFSRWLWKDGRAREHHLAHLATANPESDRRRRRRALPPDEANRLVRAASVGPVAKGMTGPDRARCYALALGTGFRRHLSCASLFPRIGSTARRRPAYRDRAGRLHEERQGSRPTSAPSAGRPPGPLAGHPAAGPADLQHARSGGWRMIAGRPGRRWHPLRDALGGL